MPSWKDPVRVATTGANIVLSGTQTIDGVALAAGDRVLVKDQTAPSENGIYDVASGAWARSSDANISALMEPQSVVRVSEGAVNGSIYNIYPGTAWLLANAAPDYAWSNRPGVCTKRRIAAGQIWAVVLIRRELVD